MNWKLSIEWSIRPPYQLRPKVRTSRRSLFPPLSQFQGNLDHVSWPDRSFLFNHCFHWTDSASPAKAPSNTAFRQSSSNDTRSVRLPTLTGDDYYTKPTMSELRSLFNDRGECHVKQFTVGRENYGSVTFYGHVNLAGLNLDEIGKNLNLSFASATSSVSVQIQRHEVIVYPDDGNKPAMGEELNLPARITLLDVYPTDRTTQEEITDSQRIRAMNYEDHLRQITQKFDGEFISYAPEDGSWTFMVMKDPTSTGSRTSLSRFSLQVKHFTRYGLAEIVADDSRDVYSSNHGASAPMTWSFLRPSNTLTCFAAWIGCAERKLRHK